MKPPLTYLFLIPVLPYFLFKLILQLRRRRARALEGKVVLITGASSGIGEALAKVLFSHGCRLILASRRVQELERVKSELVRGRQDHLVYVPAVVQCDLSDLNSLNGFSKEVLSIYGHIDILVQNAGISYRGAVLETPIDVDMKLMTVNYFGALALIKELVPSMVERKSGGVVFVSSVQGKIAVPFRSSYTTSKHAIQALADSLRAELVNTGVKISTISPGYVKTSLSLNALTPTGVHGQMDDATANGHDPDYVAMQIVNRAILKGENDVVISSIMPKIGIYLRNVAPELFFYFMGKRAMRENKLK